MQQIEKKGKGNAPNPTTKNTKRRAGRAHILSYPWHRETGYKSNRIHTEQPDATISLAISSKGSHVVTTLYRNILRLANKFDAKPSSKAFYHSVEPTNKSFSCLHYNE
jgi:hypothetical protein